MSQLNQNTEDLQELLDAVTNLPTGSGGGGGNIINIPIRVVSYEEIEPTYSSVNVYYVNDQGIACMEHITEDTTINALENSILVAHAPGSNGIVGTQQLPDDELSLRTKDWDGYPIAVVKVQSSLYIQII